MQCISWSSYGKNVFSFANTVGVFRPLNAIPGTACSEISSDDNVV